MSTIVVVENLPLDGVMQAPGRDAAFASLWLLVMLATSPEARGSGVDAPCSNHQAVRSAEEVCTCGSGAPSRATGVCEPH